MGHHKSFSFHNILLLLLAGSVIGCSSPEKPITKQEALDFAKKLEISIGKRQAQFLDDAMDINLLLKRADLPSGKNAAAFRSGLVSGMKMGTSIVNGISDQGEYVFIKEYEKNDTPHLIFRVYDAGRLNYHDIELVRSDGLCKVADMYIYITGEKLSETLHNFYLQLAEEIKNSQNDDSSSMWLDKITEIRSLFEEKKYEKANELFRDIPEKVRSGKLFQVLHISVCSNLSQEEYVAAIDEYRKLFPDEPNTALLLIDGYILHKEYNKALDAVNELDSTINKDPFLDFYRYLCYNLLQEKDKSKESIERLVRNEPDFRKGVIELIATYLADHDYEQAKPWIEKYKLRPEWDQTSLELLLLRYPDFEETNNTK